MTIYETHLVSKGGEQELWGLFKNRCKILASQIWRARVRMLLLQGKGPKSQLVTKVLTEFLGNFGLQMKMQTSYSH
jgi:hypothetical protein